MVGDKQQKVGPFKNLRAPDIPRSSASLKSARKRLSDWRFVMTYYESKLDEIEGCPTNCPLIRRRESILQQHGLEGLRATTTSPPVYRDKGAADGDAGMGAK